MGDYNKQNDDQKSEKPDYCSWEEVYKLFAPETWELFIQMGYITPFSEENSPTSYDSVESEIKIIEDIYIQKTLDDYLENEQ